jgi:hypothetical protein
MPDWEAWIKKIVRPIVSERSAKILRQRTLNEEDASSVGRLDRDDPTIVVLANGQRKKAVIGGTPPNTEVSLRLADDSHYFQHQLLVPQEDDLSGGVLLLLKEAVPTFDVANAAYFIRHLEDSTIYKITVPQLYAICGAPYDPARNKIVKVAFTPKGRHLFVGARNLLDGNGGLQLHWGVLLNFEFKTGPSRIESRSAPQQGSYLLKDNLGLAVDPGKPAIPGTTGRNSTNGYPVSIFCGLESATGAFNEAIEDHQTWTEVDDPLVTSTLPQGIEITRINGIYVISETTNGSPVVDFIGNFENRYSNSSAFRNTSSSYHSHTTIDAYQCCGGLIAGHSTCVGDSTRDTSAVWLSWDAVLFRWNVHSTLVTAGSSSGCARFPCPPGFTEYNCQPDGLCGSNSSSSGNNFTVSGFIRLGANGFFGSVSEGNLESVDTWVLTNYKTKAGVFMVQHLETVPTLSQRLTRQTTHLEGCVIYPNTYTQYRATVVESDNGLETETVRSAFRAITGGTASANRSPESFGPFTYLYEQPYNAIPPLNTSSSIFLVTDHLVFPTSSPADWASCQKVKAVDSFLFQSYQESGGEAVVKSYHWDIVAANVVEDESFRGSFFDTGLYLLSDITIVN